MNGVIIPQQTFPLQLFCMFVVNEGVLIEYSLFSSITPAYAKRVNLTFALSCLRPILRMNGFEVSAVSGEGYMCRKIV